MKMEEWTSAKQVPFFDKSGCRGLMSSEMAHDEMMSDWGRHANLHPRAESSCLYNVMSFVRSNR